MAETLTRLLTAGSVARPDGEKASEAGPPLLLLGGPGSGKTSLLFAAALEAAGEGQGPVLFLARRPLQSLPPATRSALDPLSLQKIRFQYPSSTRALLRLLCSAHEARAPTPSLLLLDGLEEYLAEDLGPHKAAHLAALLLDTAAHFSHRAGPGRACGVMVAFQTQEEADSGEALQLALLQRYFPAQCWLQPAAPGPGRHCLQATLEPDGQGARREWQVAFGPEGEMTITPSCTTADDPSLDKGSSSRGQL